MLSPVLLPAQPLHSQPRSHSPRPETCQTQADNGQALPLWRFAPYELVTDQLAAFGVTFKDAMAIMPSNPSFIDHSARCFLMPVGNQRQLRLTLQRRFQTVLLRMQGYQDFRVDVVDAVGHGLGQALQHPCCITHAARAPFQDIQVHAAFARDLLIASAGPFLLKAIYLWMSPDEHSTTLANRQKRRN